MTRRTARPRYATLTTTVAAAIGDAFSQFSSLRDEMEDWRSNIEEKFSQTDKYSRIEECVSALENFCDNEPDVPDGVQDLEVVYTCDRKANSRAARLGEAISMLDAVVSALEARAEELREVKDEEETTEEQDEAINEAALRGEEIEENEMLAGDIDSLVEEITGAVDEASSVEFVGMFG